MPIMEEEAEDARAAARAHDMDTDYSLDESSSHVDAICNLFLRCTHQDQLALIQLLPHLITRDFIGLSPHSSDRPNPVVFTFSRRAQVSSCEQNLETNCARMRALLVRRLLFRRRYVEYSAEETIRQPDELHFESLETRRSCAQNVFFQRLRVDCRKQAPHPQ